MFCSDTLQCIFHTEQGLRILFPISSIDHLEVHHLKIPVLTWYNIRYGQLMYSWNIYNPSEVFIYSSMTITVQNQIAGPLKPGARRWESVAKTLKFNQFRLTDSRNIRNHRITCQPIYRHADSGDKTCMFLCICIHLSECVLMHVYVSFCPPAGLPVSRRDLQRKRK